MAIFSMVFRASAMGAAGGRRRRLRASLHYDGIADGGHGSRHHLPARRSIRPTFSPPIRRNPKFPSL
jgi:hypothetical protein